MDSDINWLALALVVIGAVNWGLVGIGLFLNQNWNVVDLLLGPIEPLAALVYIIVGIAGLWVAYEAWVDSW